VSDPSRELQLKNGERKRDQRNYKRDGKGLTNSAKNLGPSKQNHQVGGRKEEGGRKQRHAETEKKGKEESRNRERGKRGKGEKERFVSGKRLLRRNRKKGP